MKIKPPEKVEAPFFTLKRQKNFEKIKFFLLLLAQVPVTSTKKSVQ